MTRDIQMDVFTTYPRLRKALIEVIVGYNGMTEDQLVNNMTVLDACRQFTKEGTMKVIDAGLERLLNEHEIVKSKTAQVICRDPVIQYIPRVNRETTHVVDDR